MVIHGDPQLLKRWFQRQFVAQSFGVIVSLYTVLVEGEYFNYVC